MAEAGELPPRPPKRRLLLAAAASIALFCASWGLLHVGFFTHSPVVDTPVYQRYGNAMAHGQVPYRDFGVEYPPGALPAFVLPALGHPEKAQFSSFRHVFEALMLVCGIATVVLTALSAEDAPSRRPALRPPVRSARSRSCSAPSSSRASTSGRRRSSRRRSPRSSRRGRASAARVLGLAVAAKVYPVVAAPLAVAYVWRRRGRAAGARARSAFSSVRSASSSSPFLALAPGRRLGLRSSASRRGRCRSRALGAAILLAAHHAFGLEITMRSSHGSQNLVGRGADASRPCRRCSRSAFLVGLWIAFARGPADRDRLVALRGGGGLRASSRSARCSRRSS